MSNQMYICICIYMYIYVVVWCGVVYAASVGVAFLSLSVDFVAQEFFESHTGNFMREEREAAVSLQQASLLDALL